MIIVIIIIIIIIIITIFISKDQIHILSYNEVNYHYKTLCLKISLITKVVVMHSVFIFGKRHPTLRNLYFIYLLSGIIQLRGGHLY